MKLGGLENGAYIFRIVISSLSTIFLLELELSLLIRFSSQVLDCLHHFQHPCVCVFLGITQVFVLLKLFPVNVIGLFPCVFFKLIELFDEFYDCSFKFIVWSSSL